MRILLTNDDGIQAEGLKILEQIAKKLSDDVWIVAPETEQSGAGHSLSLHLPVRVRKISEKTYAVSGTPTDCVLLALKEIIPNYVASSSAERSDVRGSTDMDSRPRPAGDTRMTDHGVDLVLSGVNRGSNAGDDITYSGTVAGAMEGAMLGVPSIAFSQLFDDSQPIQWETGATHGADIVRKLMTAGWPQNIFMNVNFPDCAATEVKGVRVCPMGKRIMNIKLLGRVDPKGRPYYWLGGERDNKADRPGVDLDLLAQGHITITPLNLDLTDYTTLEKLLNLP